MADLIIIVVLAAAVVLVIRYQKKQKGSGCGGSCAGCSGCGSNCGFKMVEGKITEENAAVENKEAVTAEKDFSSAAGKRGMDRGK